MSESWYTWYLGGADSESRLRFLKFRLQNSFLGKFGLKSQNCPFCLKIGAHAILEELIPNPDLDFGNSDPTIQFLRKFQPKKHSLLILI